MPRPPRWILLLCLALAGVLALSAAYGVVRTLSGSPVNWFVFGFELLTLIAGGFGLASGLGRFRDGPALAMLCVGGAALVASALSYTAGHKGYAGMDRDAMTLARLAASCGIMGLGALTAMARRPHASAGAFWRGALMSALAAGAATLLLGRGPRAALSHLHPIVESVAYLALGVLLIVFVSAAGHHFIRALEHGKDPPNADPNPSKPDPAT